MPSTRASRRSAASQRTHRFSTGEAATSLITRPNPTPTPTPTPTPDPDPHRRAAPRVLTLILTLTLTLTRHGDDESHHPSQPPAVVAFARSTEEVQAVVRLCAESRTPLVPFGAGTSLEGHITATRGGAGPDEPSP